MSKILSSLIFLALIPNNAFAQIIPDRTLGAENSVVESNGNQELINGGAIRDTNLFHSFQEFNVEAGKEAYFTNPDGIANIFSRVTGNNISDIQGVLGVLGNANLFFLNPNGIIFGENASLDVGGSFVASTANAIQFGDRGWFSATDPEQPPLLTVQPSAFFFNQIKAGRIENRSIAQAGVDLRESPLFGLRVPDGQSLLLLSGDIAIDGGGLHAPGGQLELAGVAGNGTIGLNVDGNNLSLGFPEAIARADISLTNEAFVNTSGDGGGEIAVWGRQVKLSDGSQIAATTLGAKAGRGLTVNASQSVDLTGTTTDKRLSSGLFTQTGGTGDAGDITITTQDLLVENGARVLAGTFSQGNAGNLTVNASESVQIIGATGALPFDDGSFSSSIRSNTGFSFGSRLFRSSLDDQTSVMGKGGNVTIITRQLQLLEGGQITASIDGNGDGGNLTVNASESVQLIGFDPVDGTPSGMFTQTRGSGNAGNITINTGSLNIINSQLANVSSSSTGGNAGNILIRASEIDIFEKSIMFPANFFPPTGIFAGVASAPDQSSLPKGNAGNLTIETNRLILRSGGEVSVSTLGFGNAGTLKILASESVEVVGTSPNENFKSQISATVRAQGTGSGGSLSLETGQMIVRDGAEVSVSSLGSGVAGNLEIQARSLSLDNQGTITATTRSGDGGDITLKVQDLLLLRRNSQISTTAGTAQAGGNGGDIDIAADLIVTFPQENSDIKANAFAGNGGNINIDAQNILGFQLQEDPIFSDITASSQFGLDGTVNINTSGIEPGQESIELPIEIVDVSKLITQNLCSAEQQGEFIITGKGGLSPSPKDTLNVDAGWEDWRMVENSESHYQQSSQTLSLPEINDRDSHQIVEAQSWFRTPNGNIVLTAQPAKSVSRSSPFVLLNCQLLDELPQ